MEPFKNNLSADLVEAIAAQIVMHWPAEISDSFDKEGFIERVIAELPALELKQRVQCISDELHKSLPKNASIRNRLLLDILHPENEGSIESTSDSAGIRGWGIMPLTALVGEYGLEDFDASMAVLKEMTKRFSSEFDVRFFLIADQTRALSIMGTWVNDENHHVRRLVSEGTRPRLPWGKQLPQLVQNPAPVLPLLEQLKDDPEEYVRRSVANHLNDIAKDHPEFVVSIAAAWMKGADNNRQRLLRHACRTLIKEGNANALAIFGYTEPEIELDSLTVNSPVVQLGESLEFIAMIRSTAQQEQSLVIDYIVYFQKQNGTLAPKVFKGKKLQIPAGEQIEFYKKQLIKPITTRRYYSGSHQVSLRINGRDYGLAEFVLEC